MPRPGSRPFECVRRAWHSDRHQPIRGSLIQEIFRVVDEVHSSGTKKNKEWQEKLPIVVLKAEEILYSKAASEAEYMDITTLWVRINQAINTIIRLDENTETGEFIHPCIEAALYLGCTPRRSSRSNRSSNLRCYLTSCTPQAIDTPPCTPHDTIRSAGCGSQYFSSHPRFSKQTSNLFGAGSKYRDRAGAPIGVSTVQKPSTVCRTIWPSINNQQLRTETVSGWNMFSLCPLYHGSNQHHPGNEILPKPLVSSSFPGPGMVKYLHSRDAIAAKRINKVDVGNSTLHERCKTPCDLSLRLGPFSVPHPSINNSHSKRIKHMGTTTATTNTFQKQTVSSSSDHPLQLDKTFSFSPRGGAYSPLEPRSRDQSFRVYI